MAKEVTLREPLPEGEVRCVQVGDKPVAVFQAQGEPFAAEDFCPHLGGPLSEGTLEGRVITCPWHGSQFDLTSGQCRRGPAKRPLVKYQVIVSGK